MGLTKPLDTQWSEGLPNVRIAKESGGESTDEPDAPFFVLFYFIFPFFFLHVCDNLMTIPNGRRQRPYFYLVFHEAPKLNSMRAF